VLFEMPGYVSVNRPLSFTGRLEEKTVVNLEKAGAVAAADPIKTDVRPPVELKAPKPDRKGPVKTPSEVKVGSTDPKPDAKAGGDTKVDPKPDAKTDGPKIDDSKVGASEPKVDTKPKGQGTLMLGSKPSCEIYVDGSATGLFTPQREMKLAAGKHRVTLINNEFGIKESFVVEVKADDTTKMIKDFSDRMPQ